jgi:hypothetical protein
MKSLLFHLTNATILINVIAAVLCLVVAEDTLRAIYFVLFAILGQLFLIETKEG